MTSMRAPPCGDEELKVRRGDSPKVTALGGLSLAHTTHITAGEHRGLCSRKQRRSRRHLKVTDPMVGFMMI